MIIPYLINGELIDLVPKEELDKWKSEASRLSADREHNANMACILRAENAELLERLQERVASHLHASARDTETIQRQSVKIDKMREAINDAHEVIRLSAYPDYAALARLKPFLK